MVILKARNVTKTYNNSIMDRIHREEEKQVLKGIDLEVFEGDCFGIMGRSGCGKTTLLKILGTIDAPSQGDIFYNGVSIKKYNDEEISALRRKGIGFVFQDFNLFECLTVEENIMIPMVLDKYKREEIDIKIKQSAELLDIEDILKKYPYEISGGEKQRVAIARAMLNDPGVILADEPTGNLDSAAALNIMEHLIQINKKQKKALLIVTHDPLIASYCNNLIFIKDGIIIDKMGKSSSQEEMYQKVLNKMLCL